MTVAWGGDASGLLATTVEGSFTSANYALSDPADWWPEDQKSNPSYDPTVAVLIERLDMTNAPLPTAGAFDTTVMGQIGATFGPVDTTHFGAQLLANIYATDLTGANQFTVSYLVSVGVVGPGQFLMVDFHAAHQAGPPTIRGTHLSFTDTDPFWSGPGIVANNAGVYVAKMFVEARLV